MATHLADLQELIVEIGERELVGPHLLFELGGLLLVEGLLGLFDQREHVAHAENTRSHALRVERLDHIELFAGADELDGLAGDGLDGQRSAAAGIAVELREHHAVDVQPFVERLGGVHGVLTGHGVHDEQNFIRLDLSLDGLQLVHQGLVHMQAAGRVEEDHVVAVLLRMADGRLGDLHGVFLPHLEHRDAELTADDLQLLDGGGAVNIAGDEQRALALLFEQTGELCAVRGLACALQTDEHNDRRRLGGDGNTLIFAAHQTDELFVDDLDDRLCRGQALQHVLPGRSAP